jgi:hypothetical protein
MKMPPYVDLHRLDEDARIDAIGHMVTAHNKRVAFMVDDVPEKADRYVRKLLAKFPAIMCEGPMKGPTPGSLTIIASVRLVERSHAP